MSLIQIDPIILAIHWDVDGVLVDSEPQHVAKLKYVCGKYGVALTDPDFPIQHTFAIPDGQGGMKQATMPLHGAGDKNIYYWLLGKKPELAATLSKEQWLDELLDHYIANKHLLKPRENIVETVEKFHQQGAIQGIVTSGIPGQVVANMHALGVSKHKMAYILTANDVTKGKPDPEGYLMGAKRVREYLEYRRIVADVFDVGVEDSPVGVQSLFNANIPAIHYVLPGQKPVVPSEDKKFFFRVAHTADEVYTQTMDMLSCAVVMRHHVLRQQHLLLQNAR